MKDNTTVDLNKSKAQFKLFQHFAQTPGNRVWQFLEIIITHTDLIPPAVQAVSYTMTHRQRETVRTEWKAVQIIILDSGCSIFLSVTSNIK